MNGHTEGTWKHSWDVTGGRVGKKQDRDNQRVMDASGKDP